MPTLSFLTFFISLTTSLAVVDRVTSPCDVAPVGASNFTISVSPVGMAVSILAVIFFFFPFAVIEYVVELSVAGTGIAPAVAVFMVRVTGAKLLSSFMSAMKYVTV